MTVKELIEELKKFPENMNVCYADYEHGNCDVNSVREDIQDFYKKGKKVSEPIILLT